ncbi:MAG TPA: hypothetical protein VGK59_09585 [Ohtaekwangia sp.]
MKHGVLIFIFSFTLCKLAAGVDELTWYEGSVVLETREVLVGEIAIESNYDLILLRADNQVMLYQAHKIQAVQFYDSQVNVNRKFISLWEMNGLLRECHLYETVLKGEVSILRKGKGLSKPVSDADDFVYYVRFNESLYALNSFRDNVYPSMVMKGGSRLSTFVLDNRLNPNKSANAIEIVRYYNRLVKDDQTLARY